jgi:hypothetical protein
VNSAQLLQKKNATIDKKPHRQNIKNTSACKAEATRFRENLVPIDCCHDFTQVWRLECSGLSRCRTGGSVTSRYQYQRMVPPVAPPPMPPEPAALDEPLEPDDPAVPDDLVPEPTARLWLLFIPLLPWPAPVAPELDVPDAPDMRLPSVVAPGMPVALCCRLTEGVLSSRLTPLGPRLFVEALLSCALPLCAPDLAWPALSVVVVALCAKAAPASSSEDSRMVSELVFMKSLLGGIGEDGAACRLAPRAS